jgi:hypothetical protein
MTAARIEDVAGNRQGSPKMPESPFGITDHCYNNIYLIE